VRKNKWGERVRKKERPGRVRKRGGRVRKNEVEE
jgi:hypothetical protein